MFKSVWIGYNFVTMSESYMTQSGTYIEDTLINVCVSPRDEKVFLNLHSTCWIV